jgi:hypothetical protein
MKLTTLGAAAVAFAAYAYLKRQRSAADAADAPRTGEPAMPGTGAESPNIAERMRAAGLAATPAASDSDALFGSSSQSGSEPASTGLPDLTRGA